MVSNETWRYLWQGGDGSYAFPTKGQKPAEFLTRNLFESESNHLPVQSFTNGTLKTAEKTF